MGLTNKGFSPVFAILLLYQGLGWWSSTGASSMGEVKRGFGFNLALATYTMTSEDFEKIRNTEHRFKKIFEYAMAVIPLAVGLYFIFLAAFTDWLKNTSTDIPSNKQMSPQSIYLCMSLTALFGLWGIWKVKRNYKIRVFDIAGCGRPAPELILLLSEKMKWQALGVQDNLFEFQARKIWESGYTILIVYEDDKLCIDIQHPSVGILDLGVQNGMYRRIARFINSRGNRLNLGYRQH